MTKVTLHAPSDSGDPFGDHSLTLNEGETLVGRGPVLGITDKRVSRKQARFLLSIERGIPIISITPITSNPLKLKRLGAAKSVVLPKATATQLKEGDVVYMLGDFFPVHVKVERQSMSSQNDVREAYGLGKLAARPVSAPKRSSSSRIGMKAAPKIAADVPVNLDQLNVNVNTKNSTSDAPVASPRSRAWAKMGSAAPPEPSTSPPKKPQEKLENPTEKKISKISKTSKTKGKRTKTRKKAQGAVADFSLDKTLADMTASDARVLQDLNQMLEKSGMQTLTKAEAKLLQKEARKEKEARAGTIRLRQNAKSQLKMQLGGGSKAKPRQKGMSIDGLFDQPMRVRKKAKPASNDGKDASDDDGKNASDGDGDESNAQNETLRDVLAVLEELEAESKRKDMQIKDMLFLLADSEAEHAQEREKISALENAQLETKTELMSAKMQLENATIELDSKAKALEKASKLANDRKARIEALVVQVQELENAREAADGDFGDFGDGISAGQGKQKQKQNEKEREKEIAHLQECLDAALADVKSRDATLARKAKAADQARELYEAELADLKLQLEDVWEHRRMLEKHIAEKDIQREELLEQLIEMGEQIESGEIQAAGEKEKEKRSNDEKTTESESKNAKRARRKVAELEASLKEAEKRTGDLQRLVDLFKERVGALSKENEAHSLERAQQEAATNAIVKKLEAAQEEVEHQRTLYKKLQSSKDRQLAEERERSKARVQEAEEQEQDAKTRLDEALERLKKVETESLAKFKEMESKHNAKIQEMAEQMAENKNAMRQITATAIAAPPAAPKLPKAAPKAPKLPKLPKSGENANASAKSAGNANANARGGMDIKSALAGVELRKAKVEEKPKAVDGRTEMMDVIRSGVALKKVDREALAKERAEEEVDDGSMLSILTRVLLARRRVVTKDGQAEVEESDSEDESEEESDEEDEDGENPDEKWKYEYGSSSYKDDDRLSLPPM